MKKVLGLALSSVLLANPALAGDVFVFNQWTIQQNRSETETNIDSTTRSTNQEEYNSSSDTIYLENGTIHRANSQLKGSFQEENTTRVFGTINTITNSYNSIHESSAGIR